VRRFIMSSRITASEPSVNDCLSATYLRHLSRAKLRPRYVSLCASNRRRRTRTNPASAKSIADSASWPPGLRRDESLPMLQPAAGAISPLALAMHMFFRMPPPPGASVSVQVIVEGHDHAEAGSQTLVQ
jgi:hypothetical protein